GDGEPCGREVTLGTRRPGPGASAKVTAVHSPLPRSGFVQREIGGDRPRCLTPVPGVLDRPAEHGWGSPSPRIHRGIRVRPRSPKRFGLVSLTRVLAAPPTLVEHLPYRSAPTASRDGRAAMDPVSGDGARRGDETVGGGWAPRYAVG